MEQVPLIVVVGVCASGKTTLSSGLKSLGYRVRSFAQEHSVTPRTWRRLKPDLLIFLDCSLDTIRKRKKVSWGMDRYHRQQVLLAEAREHADLVVNTDGLRPEELVEYVRIWLEKLGVGRVDHER